MRKALKPEELICHFEELAADENYVSPMRKIVDFSNLDDSPMPSYAPEDFVRLKAFYEGSLRGEHCVFVGPTNLRYGMARLFGGHMDNAALQVSVVRSLEEALALLEIAEEDFRAGLSEETS
jgi:hypothetical protein